MILVNYIIKEIFKNQLIILSLLLLICIFQKLIKILELSNNFPIYFTFLYLILGIPELGKLIIPFSLFLSVIITFYRLHMYNEILAMYSCAIKKSFFIQYILLYTFIILFLAVINMLWLSPYCEQYRAHILLSLKKNNYINELIEKKFQFFSNQNLIIFIDKVHDKTLKNIFIIKNKYDKNNDTFSIITAEQGDMYYLVDRLQSIILKAGIYYEIPNNESKCSNIYITNFVQYEIITDYNLNLPYSTTNTVSDISTNQLQNVNTIETRIEFSWRITLLISILIMPLIAFLLMANISYNYLVSFLLAIILYTFFFLSHILLRSYSEFNYSYSIIWDWIINSFYFIIIFFINLWQNVKPTVFFKKIICNILKKN